MYNLCIQVDCTLNYNVDFHDFTIKISKEMSVPPEMFYFIRRCMMWCFRVFFEFQIVKLTKSASIIGSTVFQKCFCFVFVKQRFTPLYEIILDMQCFCRQVVGVPMSIKYAGNWVYKKSHPTNSSSRQRSISCAGNNVELIFLNSCKKYETKNSFHFSN